MRGAADAALMAPALSVQPCACRDVRLTDSKADLTVRKFVGTLPVEEDTWTENERDIKDAVVGADCKELLITGGSGPRASPVFLGDQCLKSSGRDGRARSAGAQGSPREDDTDFWSPRGPAARRNRGGDELGATARRGACSSTPGGGAQVFLRQLSHIRDSEEARQLRARGISVTSLCEAARRPGAVEQQAEGEEGAGRGDAGDENSVVVDGLVEQRPYRNCEQATKMRAWDEEAPRPGDEAACPRTPPPCKENAAQHEGAVSEGRRCAVQEEWSPTEQSRKQEAARWHSDSR